MSYEALETILIDLKSKGMNFLKVKSDKQVEYVLQDFIYVLTGLTSSENVFDIVYIDNNRLNIIDDGRYKYIIIRDNTEYKVYSTDILSLPTQKILN